MKYLIATKKYQFLTRRQIAGVLFIFLTIGSLLISSPREVLAQAVVTDPALTAVQTEKSVWDKIKDKVKTLWNKAGSYAYQRTLRTALNKIAYDTANYIGSGGEGQKPLFVTQGWGDYLLNVGDQAAGEFLENFVNQWSVSSQKSKASENCDDEWSACVSFCDPYDEAAFNECYNGCTTTLTNCKSKSSKTDNYTSSFNVCEPSSIEAKVKISLGLVSQNRAQDSDCSASEIINNWGDDLESLQKKYATIKEDPEKYLSNFAKYFDPVSNDLGISVIARTDLSDKALVSTENTKLELLANKGWLDVRNVAGDIVGAPGEAERNLQLAKEGQQTNIGEVTGDILVDSANIFLNQLAISAFNNLIKNIGKTTSGSSPDVSDYESDPSVKYGETKLTEVTSKLLEADYTELADYNILTELSICTDSNNPGPDNCVIDSLMMQAISENKTVGQAMKEGLLHGDWQFMDTYSQNNYSSRNLAILRKYRIVPIGWEVAVEKAYASSTHIRKATLSDLVSCFDPNDAEYYTYSSSFDRKDTAWCVGLVDPNWVLKAPLNYCRKSGYSSQIISSQIIPGIKGQSGVADTLNTLNLVRADEYCADNQTCIKENENGTCDKYGYCTEEKKIWSFGTKSCDPVFNTCQTFTNSDSGQSVSYLENTLDYGDCTIDNAGCRQYSLFGLYSTSTSKVSWSSGWSLYLNSKLDSCDSKKEGCTELVRVRAGQSNSVIGTNLIMNSGFSADALNASSTGDKLNDWPIVSSGSHKATIVDASQDPGGFSGKALKLEGNGGSIGIASTFENSLVPTNLQIISGQAYTLSADVYLKQGDKVTLYIGPSSDGISQSLSEKNVWRRVSITRSPADTYNEPAFSFVGTGGQVVFYLKNLKLEMSSWDTGYSTYASNKIYEKLLPAYLESACYVNGAGATKDYSLKSDAPTVCSNFARKCNRDEVGCELYTAAKDGFSIPAQATDQDMCPAECVGYDVYVSKATYFNSAQAENLIPETADSCSADVVGCNEFTNLDELAKGGEAKEYYTYLKQCIKPDTSACGNFYAWEGTDSGYQLKSYSLKKDGDEPAVTVDDSSLCNAEIHSAPVGSDLYNADCQEFYNIAGRSFYHLLSRTITCSDNCHAYRLTAKDIDSRLTAAQCVGNDKHWDAGTESCYVCQNGGVWDNSQAACLYQAIPDEGLTCSADENGCREYNGNSGNNVRLVSYFSFEDNLGGWTSNCNSGVSLSPVSNSKDGHSLYYDSQASGCSDIEDAPVAKRPIIEALIAGDNVAAQLNVNGLVTAGRAYTAKFLSRSASDTNLQIYILNTETKEKSLFNDGKTIKIKGGNEWNLYQANLANLDHKLGSNELLIITADKSLYLDDLVISEISDRYYLIKDSSEIPQICYYDELDNYQGAEYNLGCAVYTNRSNEANYFHRFSDLCALSAVGCEQMIDTKNYSPSGTGIWNDTDGDGTCDGDEKDCIQVAGDSAIYAVYDTAKLCSAADQGCSRLGQGSGSGQNLVWSDVYRSNNPNDYDNILCGQTDVGCTAWQMSDGSTSYFKDPGLNTCVYRVSQDPAVIGKSWYKSPVKRCDNDNNGLIEGKEKDGSVCTDGGCGSKPCIVDNNDYLCSVSYFKTIGLGGAGNQIATPDQGAGLCQAGSAGCTEYIDPVSRFSSNVVYNPSYQLSDNRYEGWYNDSEKWQGKSVGVDDQVVSIVPNKLYILAVESTEGNNPGEVSLEFMDKVKPLVTNYAAGTEVNNVFGTSTNSLVLPAFSADRPVTVLFYSTSNTKALLSGGSSGKTIVLREAVVGYQLNSNIDKKSCTKVDFENGCVLFNERKVNGNKGLANLNIDAFRTADGQSILTCAAGDSSCTANTLVKVNPDRTCGKWLSCISYIQDEKTKKPDICYSFAECDRLNDQGECANFVSAGTTGNRLFDLGRDRNASGYSIVNDYYLTEMKEVGVNSEAHYDFEESVPALSCRRDVEFPGGSSACLFDSNITKDSIVREPSSKAVDYPANGRSYLRVPAAYQISPVGVDNFISLDTTSTSTYSTYYLNLLVNTRGSGLAAKVIITGRSNQAKALTDAVTGDSLIFYAAANSGWERKVFKFNLTKANAENGIKIYLTSNLQIKNNEKPQNVNYVYFDDINIEPVLEVGKDQYAARECRLYPSSNSLACINKENNTIQEGLEGYCLEHDPANPRVCLTWYPVDKISATNSRPSQGYSGKTPLNYCTAVDGNFTLVEKREAKKIYDDNRHDGCGGCNDTGCGENGYWCFFPKGTDLNEAVARYPICGTCYQASNDGRGSGTRTVCSRAKNDGSFVNSALTGSDEIDSFSCGTSSTSGADDYFLLIQRWRDCAKDENNQTGSNHFDYCVSCIPMSEKGEMMLSTTQPQIKCETNGNILSVPQTAGWYKYDGLQCSPAGDCAYINEGEDENPVRVYDYNNPPQNENSLKYISGNDQGKTYRLTCNQFVQVVESSGDNQAWTSRVSKATEYPYETPSFFRDAKKIGYFSSPYLLSRYGRNREDIPFGSASWPEDLDLLSSPAITLRDQYSKKNDEEIYAGRPYGCTQSGQANGCQLIGSCSLDPSVYCLVDDAMISSAASSASSRNYVKIETCADNGLGTCVPLWSTSTSWISSFPWTVSTYTTRGGRTLTTKVPGGTGDSDSVNILKTLFLKAYNSFAIGSEGNYISTSTYDKSRQNSGISGCSSSSRPEDSTATSSFCAIFPRVYNIELYIGDTKRAATSSIVGSALLQPSETVEIKKGIYRLEFNTSVDAEQQPLRRISIDWGDGRYQVVTDQDQRPSSENRHVFYHYYMESKNNVKIKIKAFDNWGFYGSYN